MKLSFFVGIDVSKLWIDASLLPISKPLIKRSSMPVERFENTKEGFDKLLTWIECKYGKDLSGLFVALEHTGLYSMPLCNYLKSHQIAYSLVEGLKIKFSMGLRREKTDPTDAKDIARYIHKEFDELPIRELAEEPLQQLAHLMSYRERLKKFKHGLQVAATELSKFAHIGDLEQMILQSNEHIIKMINEAMKQIKKEVHQIINQHQAIKENYDLITTVPGIAWITGTYMIITTGNFTRFDNGKQYSCYVGCAPFKKQSGSSIRGKTKVSHFANKHMKALLTNGARSAINNSPEIHLFYQRKIKQGKEDFCVVNIIRNKIIHRVFAVVKRRTPYVDTMEYHTISRPAKKTA